MILKYIEEVQGTILEDLEIDELAGWGSGGDGVILGQGPGGEVGPLVRGSTQLGQGRWTLAL